MAVEIGALRALLSLDSAQFVKGVKIAKGSLGNFQHQMRKVSKSASDMGKKLSASITLPMAGLATVAVKTSLSTVDAQAKLARSLDTSVASMQVLTRAAELAGVEVSGLEQLSKDLTRRLSQAAEGGGPAADALKRLGLNAEGLLSMPLDQRIATINEAIGEFIPKAEQAAVAGKLFGEEGSIAAARLDPATINAAGKELERFGVIISDVDARKIEEANDALSSIRVAVTGIANRLTVALAPVLEKIADRLANAVAWFSNLSPQMKKVAAISAALAAAAGPALLAIGGLAAAASVAAGGIALIGGAIAAVLSPVGLLVAAVAGAGVLIYRNWDEIKEKFPAITGAITSAFANMKEAFSVQITGMVEIGKGLLASLEALFSGDFGGVISGLSDAFRAVRETIVGTMDALLGQVDEKLIALATGIAAKIREAFNDVVAAVVEFKDMVIAEVKTVAANITTVAMDIGRNLVAGLTAGLRERWESVKSTISGLASAIKGRFERDTEIKSPSRVFKRYGQNIADGLIIGIDGRNGAVSTSVGGLAKVTTSVGDALEGVGRSAAVAGQGISNMVGQAGAQLGQLKSQAEQAAGAVGGAFSSFASDLVTGDAKTALSNFGSNLKNVAAQAFSGAIEKAFSAGGGGLSGLFSGFGAGLKSFGAGISSFFSGGGLSALSGAIGGIMPVIGGAMAIVNLIKGFSSKKLIGTGFDIGVDAGKLIGGSFQRFFKTSWWGLSKKTVEEFTSFDGQVANGIGALVDRIKDIPDSLRTALTSAGGGDTAQLRKFAASLREQITNVQKGVAGTFRVLGITVSDAYLKSVSFAAQRVETMGKNNKQIAAAVNKVFRGYGDALAKAVGNVSLAELNQIISVQAILAPLGKAFDIIGGQVRGLGSKIDLKQLSRLTSSLKLLAGGMDKLASKSLAFFDAFYSEAEKLDILRDRVADVFAGLNLSVPKTAVEFRKLVEAQDLLTGAGRKAYVALLDIAPTFKTVTDAAVQSVRALRGEYNLDASGFASEWQAKLADEMRNVGRFENDLLNAQNASLIRQEALLQSIDNRLRKQGNATLDNLTLQQMGTA